MHSLVPFVRNSGHQPIGSHLHLCVTVKYEDDVRHLPSYWVIDALRVTIDTGSHWDSGSCWRILSARKGKPNQGCCSRLIELRLELLTLWPIEILLVVLECSRLKWTVVNDDTKRKRRTENNHDHLYQVKTHIRLVSKQLYCVHRNEAYTSSKDFCYSPE